MNRTEYLLACLAEECGEVIQAVGKSLRFGLNDHRRSSNVTNREEILKEFNDIFAIMHMLRDEGVFNDDLYKPEHVMEKIAKVERYMEYSAANGIFQQLEKGNCIGIP